MNPHARKVLVRNATFARTQRLDFSYWVTIAAQNNRNPLILNRAQQFGKMGLGFVNTYCFHDLLVRIVNLYWAQVSSLIYLSLTARVECKDPKRHPHCLQATNQYHPSGQIPEMGLVR